MVNSFTKIDEELFEELEELLVMGDVGVNTAGFICDRLRQRIKEKGITDPSLIMGELKAIVSDMLQGDNEPAHLHQALHHLGDWRQRRGQDHHHRQAGLPLEGGGASP